MERLPTLCARLVRALNRKIAFVIVEGPSDKEALHVMFERAFNRNGADSYVYVVHGDITSRRGITPANVRKEIASMVKSYAARNGLRQSDFEKVIHLMDTDGAFVDSSRVIEAAGLDRAQYYDSEIRCRKPEDIVTRNAQKAAVMRQLAATSSVWRSIPYEPYYMSCNLDHVLYDKQNLSDDEKEDEAVLFSRKYHDDVSGFIQFICHSPFSVMGTRRETWRFIEVDDNSLKRHSNLGNLFASI